MNIMMINGSPKCKDSNSQYFLDLLKGHLSEEEITEENIVKVDNYKRIVDSFEHIEVLVLAFPIYVDTLPSHVMRFLTYIEGNYKKQSTDIKVYVISNCGFYEGRQNRIAISVMKCFCKRMNFQWGQGVGIGAGEMMGVLKKVPEGKGPNTSLGQAIKKLSDNIINKVSDNEIYTEPSYFPKIAFKLCANNFWVQKAKKNGLKKKDLDKCMNNKY